MIPTDTVERSVLERVFGLPAGELRPLLGLAGVYATIGAAVAAGDATVQAVFISRAGADQLPLVLLIRAVISPVLALSYARLVRPRKPRPVLVLLALGAAGAEAGGFVLMDLGSSGALAAYVVHELVASLVTVHWGVYLLSQLGGDRALRGVGLVYAAARLGAAIAGAALVPIVSGLGAPSGMFLVVALFATTAATAALRRGADDDELHPETHAEEQAEDEAELPRVSMRPPSIGRPREPMRGWQLLLSSPLLPALAAATAAMVFVRFALRFQQQQMLETLAEAELVTLLSVYAIGANLIGVLLQVFGVGRLLPRLGLTRLNTFYALVAAAAQGALLLAPGLGAALFARFSDSELKHSVKTPLSSLFYEAFPEAERGPARAVVLGIASPSAQVVAALGLHAVVTTGAPVAALIGAIAAAFFLVATIAQNRGYERAIGRGSLPPKPAAGPD